MKSMLLTAMLLLSVLSAWAQTDPTIMTIDGKPVSRSEFEYSYNKNNSEMVVDKKSVAEYVDLFINYKLKVLAAEEAGIDTTQSFKKEFLSYRDQQIRPSFLSNDDLKREASEVADYYGLDLSSVTRAFYKQMVNTRRIPLTFAPEEPNAESLEAIRESDAFLASGKKGRFDNGTDLIAAAMA